MNEPRPAPSNDKALGDVLMGDLSEPQARESVIKQTNRKILKLPRELRIEILSYVLRQGDTIKMKEGKISRERRKWNAEVERLKDPNWKRPGKAEAPGALLACREMYISGVETFWGGNTFSFANVSELQQFLGFATALAKKSLKSIDLFHHYRPSDAPIASGPTLQVLGAFVNLESIDIDTSFLGPPPAISEFDSRYKSYDEGFTAYYEPTNQTEANRDNMYWNPVLDPLKARDRFVNTIPPSALATLSTLQVRNRREPKPDVANILSYVRDLHKSDWSAAPFAPGEGSPSANVERSWNHQLWLEARAAVHWANDYGPAQAPIMEKRLYQWCTWSAEWIYDVDARERMGEIMGEVVVPKLKPRSFEELFETVEGEVKVREEHSWEKYLEDHQDEGGFDEESMD